MGILGTGAGYTNYTAPYPILYYP